MKKFLMGLALTGALGVTVSTAMANPIGGPVAAPVHPGVVTHTLTPSLTKIGVSTSALNAYRALRRFWLSRAIMR